MWGLREAARICTPEEVAETERYLAAVIAGEIDEQDTQADASEG